MLVVQKIRELFHVTRSLDSPLFAGFGNTETDEESYRNVGISDDRIFIITKVNVLLCSEYSIASVSCSNMNGNPEYVS